MLAPLLDVHDLVSELLLGAQLGGVRYRRVHVVRPSGLSFGKAPGRAQFRLVGRRPASLRDASGVTMRLEAGDAVLLLQGTPHALLSNPDMPCREVTGFESAKICDTVASVGVGAEVALSDMLVFSAYTELDLGGIWPLVGTMPEFTYVGTLLACYPETHPVLDAMERESCSERAGFAGILTRLVDVAVVFIVCGWVEYGCDDATGWVQALHELELGSAVAILHHDPGCNRSVAELVAQADVSRSVFAERFLVATGMTPAHYLTELRVRLAAQWIIHGREVIEAVAYRFDYGSLAAFSCALKQVVGRPPGAMHAEDAEAGA